LNEPNHHHNDCDDQQDMNKITKRIAAHQPQQPQNYQYDSDRPQHMILLSDCSFPLPAIASPTSWQWEYNLYGLGLGLLDGHPIRHTVHAV